MKFRITIDDKAHNVEFRQPISRTNPSTVTIDIDGKVFTIGVTERDENGGATKLKVNEQEYRVELVERNIPDGKPLNININGAPFQIKVDIIAGTVGSAAEVRARKTDLDAKVERVEPRTAGRAPMVVGKIIRPPMPGKIISVRVKEGDMVKSGDVVLILEAMKMANEITTPYTGKIKEVRVSAGQSVAPEDVVISME